MRRKLFFCTFLIILLMALFLGYYEEKAGQREPLINNKTETNNVTEYYGQIVSIQNEGNEYSNLVIRLDNGQKVLLKYYEDGGLSQKLYGSKIVFEGELKLPDKAKNPGCFDYSLYLKSLGIEYICTAQNLEVLVESTDIYDRYCRLLLVKKEAFLATIEDERTRNFVDGILFGNTGNLEEDLYEEFKTNGTAHILAVSGLHIGIIYKIIQRILGKKATLINFIIIVMLLWSLGILAGWTPSVTRAIGMILLKSNSCSGSVSD